MHASDFCAAEAAGRSRGFALARLAAKANGPTHVDGGRSTNARTQHTRSSRSVPNTLLKGMASILSNRILLKVPPWSEASTTLHREPFVTFGRGRLGLSQRSRTEPPRRWVLLKGAHMPTQQQSSRCRYGSEAGLWFQACFPSTETATKEGDREPERFTVLPILIIQAAPPRDRKSVV